MCAPAPSTRTGAGWPTPPSRPPPGRRRRTGSTSTPRRSAATEQNWCARAPPSSRNLRRIVPARVALFDGRFSGSSRERAWHRSSVKLFAAFAGNYASCAAGIRSWSDEDTTTMPIRSSALAVLTATALLVGTASPAALRAASPGPTGDGELPVGRGGASHLAYCHRGLAAAAAAVDITPTPPPGHTLSEVYLGGYGLGPHRPATWVRDPLFARALVLGCVGQTGSAVAVEEIDNQGMSVAYRPTVGPYGLEDIRTAAASAAGISRSHIILATDHSHAGPDLIGVWGFVPTWYLQEVAAGASRAIATAAATLRPVTLSVGSVRAPELVHTQFDDPSVGALDHVDDAVRVLRATAADGTVVSTLVDFAAHSTVMGSTNRGVSPDWPGRLATMLEAAGGNGPVVVLEGTNGKTQPVRPLVPDDL